MKKLSLLFSLTLLSLSTIMAQDSSSGVKAGVNFSNFVGDDADGVDSRTGFHIGIAHNIKISDVFAFQPEALYSSQGAKFSEDDVKYKLDYIAFPFLADVTVFPGLSLQAGPQLGFLINEEVESEGISVELDEAENFDLSAAVGAQYKLDDLNLFFQIRYYYGFTDVIEDININNSNFTLSIGYIFF